MTFTNLKRRRQIFGTVHQLSFQETNQRALVLQRTPEQLLIPQLRCNQLLYQHGAAFLNFPQLGGGGIVRVMPVATAVDGCRRLRGIIAPVQLPVVSVVVKGHAHLLQHGLHCFADHIVEREHPMGFDAPFAEDVLDFAFEEK